MRGQCIVCGKPVAEMALVVIAEGWRHCCRQLYPPLYPPGVPSDVICQERAAVLSEKRGVRE